MTEHITNQEWIEYLNCTEFGETQLKLFARVHAHIGECAECRALHAASVHSQEALRGLGSAAFAAMPSAYRAVAAQPGIQIADDDEDEAGSMLVVPFCVTGGVARFTPDQLLAEGEADRYELISSEDAAKLTDDFDDSIYLECASGRMTISLPDSGCKLTATFANADGVIDLPAFDASGLLCVPLPDEGRYLLTIRFENP